MVNQDLEAVVAERMKHGDTTRDEVLKQELIRTLLYTEAGSISVGANVVGTQTMDSLATEFAFPGHMTAEYPVTEDSNAPRQHLTWDEFKIRLHKAHVRFGISDGAKLEGMGDTQLDRTRRRASEALARRKDENILGVLASGAFSENEEPMGTDEEWNHPDESLGADIEEQLWEMWEDIVINAPVSSLDEMGMDVVLPARVYTQTNRLELINNIQQRMRDYLGQTFNFNLYGHKVGYFEDDQAIEQYGTDLQDTAIMVLGGPDTAMHMELDPQYAASRDVPLIESERQFRKGEQYYISQWYNTAIMEHESGEEGASPRISVRTNVNYYDDYLN